MSFSLFSTYMNDGISPRQRTRFDSRQPCLGLPLREAFFELADARSKSKSELRRINQAACNPTRFHVNGMYHEPGFYCLWTFVFFFCFF